MLGTLIVFALSNLLTALLTARLVHRARANLSPLPPMPSIREQSHTDEEADGFDHDTQPPKGRPIA